MEGDVIFIGEEDDAIGFQLLGAKAIVAKEREAIQRILELIKEREKGVVIANESIKKFANEEEIKEIEESDYPIVLFIPS